MHDSTQFFAILLIHLLGAMSPGPDFFLITTNSLARGTRAGLLTAVGVVTGVCVQLATLLLGASLLFAPGSRTFLLLRLVGAAYLIYLGVRALTTTPTPFDDTLPAPRATGTFVQGLLTNLTNAKAWIYWVSIGTQFVHTSSIALLVSLVVITLAWFSTLAFVVGRESVRRRLLGGRGILEKGMGLLLLSYGVGVLWTVRL